MLQVLATYPYLANALLMTIACAAGLALMPRQAKAIFWSGLLSLSVGLAWPVSLVPAYWTPHEVVTVWRYGIEDFIWALATGGLAWLCAVSPLAAERTRPFEGRFRPLRFVLTGLASAAAFIPLWLLGAKAMTAFIGGVLAAGAFLLAVRRDYWRLAIGGAVGFGLINLLAMKATLIVAPDYYAQMTPGALSGATIWGLAVEELYWAFAAGAVWPMTAYYAFDLRPLAADFRGEH